MVRLARVPLTIYLLGVAACFSVTTRVPIERTYPADLPARINGAAAGQTFEIVLTDPHAQFTRAKAIRAVTPERIAYESLLDGKRDLPVASVQAIRVPNGSYMGRGAWIGAVLLAAGVAVVTATTYDPHHNHGDLAVPKAVAMPLSAIMAAPVGALYGAVFGWSIKKQTLYELPR
jgi:hypothetical protein